MQPLAFMLLRIVAGGLAGLVGVTAIWLVVSQLASPGSAYFPANAQDAELLSSQQERARTAANIGMVRGDLWAAAAIAEAAPLLFQLADHRLAAPTRDTLENARMTVERAAAMSPHDARIWLIFAGLQTRSGKASANAVEALKLSYYTGPNEFALAPLRLSVAAGVPWDEELQVMVQTEIQRIVLKRSDLKPAIAAAYKSAISDTRKRFETTVKQVDPGLF